MTGKENKKYTNISGSAALSFSFPGGTVRRGDRERGALASSCSHHGGHQLFTSV